MFTWIADNLATIAICLFLAAIVTAIILKLVKDKKKGRSSCGCNCESCYARFLPQQQITARSAGQGNAETVLCFPARFLSKKETEERYRWLL